MGWVGSWHVGFRHAAQLSVELSFFGTGVMDTWEGAGEGGALRKHE